MTAGSAMQGAPLIGNVLLGLVIPPSMPPPTSKRPAQSKAQIVLDNKLRTNPIWEKSTIPFQIGRESNLGSASSYVAGTS